MEEPVVLIEELYEKVKEYGTTNAELIKLETLDKVSRTVAPILVRLISSLFVFMFFLILSIAVSLWLGEETGKTYYGFFMVAGFYGLVGVIVHYFLLKRMKNYIGNSLIERMLN